MAHNLDTSTGTAAFYSLKEPGWHKLGNVVERPVTDDEALRLAGLDWEAELVPLCRQDMVPIESHMAIVRSDNKHGLGVVGRNYCPLQNREMFKWLRGLETIGDVVIETAGSIGLGETVWALGRVKDLRFDIKGDAFQGYLSLTNSHDGSRKFLLSPTCVRQQCWNTTAMIIGQKRAGTMASGWELRHTSGIHANLEEIRKLYAQTADAWKSTEEALRFLADKPLTEAKLVRLFTEPFIPKVVITPEAKAEAEAAEAETKDESVRAAAIRLEREKRLREILASPTNQMAGTKDTIFAGFQALSEFCDYEIGVRSKADSDESRTEARLLSSNFGGRGDAVKRSGFKLALELAESV